MKIDNFPCPICDSNDYHDTELHSEKTLVLCKNCGSLWHKRDNTKEEGILDFYRKEYRQAPDHKNIIFSNNKLNYIAKFLSDFLKDKKGLICTDIGCATGYLPNWLRKLGHRATGTEYTITYRRMAEHFYGIPVTEKIEKKHKYDLISFYHVLEHMFKPDEKLKEVRECLSENGRILIAVPRFLHVYDDPSGAGATPFDQLYHKNHINLFTLTAIKNLFAKVGLEIEKEDTEMYGMTFLLKRCEPKPITPESWEANLKILQTHKQTWEHMSKGRFKEAFDLCPATPTAWIGFINQVINKDPARQQDTWNAAFAVPELTNNSKLQMHYAMWLQQQERYEEAIAAYDKVLELKPNADWFYQKGICLTMLKRHDEAIWNFGVCQKMQPFRWQECNDWAIKNACSIPTWEEKAIEQVKNEVIAMNKDKIALRPRDKVMDAV